MPHEWNHTIRLYDFCVLLSLNVISVRLIHVVVGIGSSFLFIAKLYFIGEIDCGFSVHSPVEGHLGYLQFGAIMKGAEMTTHGQVSLETEVFIFLG